MSGRKYDQELAFVQLAAYVSEGKARDAAAFIRRELPAIGRDRPDLDESIRRVLAGIGGGALARALSLGGVPADRDTKMELLREELDPTLTEEPIWPPVVEQALKDVVAERGREAELAQAGITPTRTLLFVGPPGVGKTMAARWLARELGRPLLTLDLASVMSSYLGRTGNNIRAVLEYARKQSAVLLLDEFDAIAKRRDDNTDVGELKRLVTVLLQSIDDWPSGGILVCATNHPELLDPAVWRRFEQTVEFPMASVEDAKRLVTRTLGPALEEWLCVAAACAFSGRGFADAIRELNGAKRDAITRGIAVQEALAIRLRVQIARLPRPERDKLAYQLDKFKVTQRAIKDLTGIARDTLRSRGIGTGVQKRRTIKSAA